jgi:ABC-type Mn2+/Zn2+ transport system permease subunit/Mn-dependent DtxR family transcriptional regulator
MIQELFNTLSAEWAIRALIASMLVGCTCGVIGCFIVLRNMSLIGDALSHSILPGIYFAFLFVGYSTLGFFVGSVIAGLITALAITWLQQNVKTKNDAAIGIVFTAMFAIGVMGISRLNNQQGNHLDLKDFLFGNIMGISNEDIIICSLVCAYTILSFAFFYRYFFITTFQPLIGDTMGISTKTVHYFLMLMLSFAVVAALRSVGVILVVAMLITPASTALLLSHKLRQILWLAGIIGMLSAMLGLFIAILTNTTPGPAMVIVSTIFFILASLFSPEKGLVVKYWRQTQDRKKVLSEDIIKYINKHGANDEQVIAENLNVSLSKYRAGFHLLVSESMIMPNGTLTIKGKQRSEELVRAHRLWETYQVDKMGLATDQIHPDAERLEHLISPADADEIEMKLGFPKLDPHGSPIPKSRKITKESLFFLKLKERGQIIKDQLDPSVESELWEMSILPLAKFEVTSIDENSIELTTMGKKMSISADLAMKVQVRRI